MPKSRWRLALASSAEAIFHRSSTRPGSQPYFKCSLPGRAPPLLAAPPPTPDRSPPAGLVRQPTLTSSNTRTRDLRPVSHQPYIPFVRSLLESPSLDGGDWGDDKWTALSGPFSYLIILHGLGEVQRLLSSQERHQHQGPLL